MEVQVSWTTEQSLKGSKNCQGILQPNLAITRVLGSPEPMWLGVLLCHRWWRAGEKRVLSADVVMGFGAQQLGPWGDYAGIGDTFS